MPGLGGRKMSAEHSTETARALNAINPDFIRIRSLYMTHTMPLWSALECGDFHLQTEDEVIEELGSLIEKLEVTSKVKSDHIMNLLPDIDGKFPEAKEACLSVIKRYLSLSSSDRLNYRLGRRAGYYDSLNDLSIISKKQKVEDAIKAINDRADETVEDVISRLKSGFG
jgi:hypothetical protein